MDPMYRDECSWKRENFSMASERPKPRIPKKLKQVNISNSHGKFFGSFFPLELIFMPFFEVRHQIALIIKIAGAT